LRGMDHSDHKKDNLYTKDKGLSGYRRTWGTLSIFSLTLEPCSHELCGTLDTGLGCLLGLYVRALCHWLQGNLGAPATKAQQHVLCHCPSQGTTFLF
jgi:hypothetical protein